MAKYDAPIPFPEMQWPAPGPVMFEIQCPKHEHVRYLTKGPQRSLHYCPQPEDFFKEECSCPLSTMNVVGAE